jgi:hypothetical protein
MIKKLEKLERFESYKEAKQHVRSLRNDQPDHELANFKIIFADSELDAEEKLQEKRDAPIIREWEK